MNKSIYYKALQRKLHFRNPKSILDISQSVVIQYEITGADLISAQEYISKITDLGISYTYPGAIDYPVSFLTMLEPPLFLEYIGQPCWGFGEKLSVVGARKIHPLSRTWIEQELSDFLVCKPSIVIVSGGAEGVDQISHLLAVRQRRPTIVVLPCGLNQIFPKSLNSLKDQIIRSGGCFLTEFEYDQSVRKNFFFFRNRLIACLSLMTLVVQSERKSGTFLTVHHALQNGKTVVTIPSHPMLSEFSGNRHLMKEGAFFVADKNDLLDFWEAESWSGRGFLQGPINI